MNKKYLVILVSVLLLFTLSSVSASEKITATSSDHFGYYGPDTPAGKTHSFSVEVDSNVYYISDSLANKLAAYSSSFRRVYEYDLDKYSNKYKPDAVSFGSNGVNAYYQLNNNQDTEMFEFQNDKTFEFEYSTGNTVGYNKNAKIITKIYNYDGKELTETLY